MEIRISILMGIYNCEATLAEAIDSIINQTYSGWKLIMCDDGSNDRTYEIAESYREKYPDKIILVKNEINKGLNFTLNHCLKYADTEYVARMDGDDISLPTRLEKEVAFLDQNPEYAIVSTNMIYFDKNGEWGKSNMLECPQRKDLVRSTPFCHAPCMVRREAYIRVKGYSVDKKLLRAEDYHLWFKMYTEGYKGYNLQEPLYKMRDDRNATQRRKYKYRVNEAYVKWMIVKEFNLPIFSFTYVVRPLMVGIIPTCIYEYLHKKRMK